MNALGHAAISLIMLALSACGSAKEEQVHVGVISERSRERMDLDQGDSRVSIGFFGEPEVLDRLMELNVGDEVRAVFGTDTPPGGERPINTLLEIRRCLKNDWQCAADRRAGDAQNAIVEAESAASEERYGECMRAMHETLLNDPRFVASPDPSRTMPGEFLDQVNSFTGEQVVCAKQIMDEHQAAVYDACEVHHCGDNIGGSCEHISSYALTDDVIERAAVVCKDK